MQYEVIGDGPYAGFEPGEKFEADPSPSLDRAVARGNIRAVGETSVRSRQPTAAPKKSPDEGLTSVGEQDTGKE